MEDKVKDILKFLEGYSFQEKNEILKEAMFIDIDESLNELIDFSKVSSIEQRKFNLQESWLVTNLQSQLLSLNSIISQTGCPIRLTYDRETIGDWIIYFQIPFDGFEETNPG